MSVWMAMWTASMIAAEKAYGLQGLELWASLEQEIDQALGPWKNICNTIKEKMPPLGPRQW